MNEVPRIRELYAEQWRGPEPPSPHLEEETWERLACDELSPAEHQVALDHITACPECASTFRGLAMLSREAHEFDKSALGMRAGTESQNVGFRRSRSHRPSRLFLGSLLATAAALLIFIALPVNRPKENNEPDRITDALRARPESQPIPAAPVGPVSEPPVAFSWEGVPGASRYRVELFSAEAEPLWQSGLVETTSLDFPADLALEPGRYYWQVRAFPSEGTNPAVSELVAFDLEARQIAH